MPAWEGATRSISSQTASTVSTPRSAPRRAASSAAIIQSGRVTPGPTTFWPSRLIRPSRLVVVPSSSAHCAEGNTTSARLAVSERKKSATTRQSSARKRSPTRMPSGAETAMFDPMTNIARTPSSVPIDSSWRHADRPARGIADAGTPHTAATRSRATGSSIRWYPGS